MFHVFAIDELFSSEIKRFLSDPFQLRISLDDVPQAGFQTLADLERIFSFELAEILDEPDDLIENLCSVLLHIAHELFDFLVLRAIDNKLVSVLHIGVEFFCEVGMREKCVADLDIAVVFIFGLLIFPEKLGDILVGLQILVFELFQPSLRLLHIELFEIHR